MTFFGRSARLPRGALAAAISLAALALVALHWWHPGTVIAFGDDGLNITPGVWFEKALPAWNDANNYFGQIDASFSFVFFMALWWLLDTIAGPGLGEIALYFLLLAAGWLGAFCLARRAGTTVAAATAGAWVYALNPFTQIAVGSFNATQCVVIAILPWLGFFLMTAAREPQRRAWARGALVVFALFAFPALGITPPLVAVFLVVSILLALFCAFFALDMRAFVRWAAVTAVPMIAVTLWWAIPDVLSFVGPSVVIPHPVALAGNAWTYAQSSLLNNERFLYMWIWAYPEYVPSAAAYDANPFAYAAGFLPFAAGLTGLVVLRGRLLAASRFALACVLATFFISKGAHAPLADFSALLWHVPGIFFFDDPAGIVVLSLLLLGIVAALAFDALRLQRLRIPVALAAVGASALSAILLVTGAVFHSAVNAPDGFASPSVYVRVPQYWTQMAEHLNASPHRGGVLLLPPNLNDGYDARYDFGYYGTDVLASNFIVRPLLMLDAGLVRGGGYLKHRDSQALADGVQRAFDARSQATLALLRDLGVRYVLYRGDFVNTGHRWLTDAGVAGVLQRSPLRFGRLSLYDLGEPRASNTIPENPALIDGIDGFQILAALGALVIAGWAAWRARS